MQNEAVAKRLKRAVATLLILAIGACSRSDQDAAQRSSPVPAKAVVVAGGTRDRLDATGQLPTEARIGPGEAHTYGLDLEAGVFIEFAVEQKGVDVSLRLFDPGGDLLIETDLPIADLGRETLLAVADRSGSYEIEVTAWDAETEGGRYGTRLTLRRADDLDRLRAQAAGLFYRAEKTAWGGNFDESVALYQKSLELWRKTEDTFWRAQVQAQLAVSLRAMGEKRRAITAREQAGALFRECEEARFEAINEFNLGLLHFELGDMERAETHLEHSLDLRRLVGDSRGEAIALTRLADIDKVRGETQRALDYLSAALPLLSAAKDKRYRAIALHSLGTLYQRLGKRQAALRNLQDAETIYRELEIHRFRAASLSQIGQLYLELRDYGRATETLGIAIELQRRVGDRRGEAVALRKIGSVRLAQGRLEDARSHYLDAMKLLGEVDSPRSLAPVLADLGSLHNEMGLGNTALDYHLEALSVFDAIGDPVGRTRALLGIAASMRQLGRAREAREAAAEALQIAETLRIKPLSEELRFAFFSTVQKLFDLYIDILMELHRLEPAAGHAAEALMASERARARSLLDLLAEADAQIRTETSPALLAREREFQRLLNVSVEQMESEAASELQREKAVLAVRGALDELDKVRTEIRRDSPRYAALTQPQPLTPGEIQRSVLDAETILLQYRLGSPNSYLWLVTTDSLEAFELPSIDVIEEQVARAHGLLRQSHRREARSQTTAVLCELAELLLGQVAGRLADSRLAIAADGALHFLPFAALPDPASERDCGEAEPLVAAHEIVYLPSASALRVLRQDRAVRESPHRTGGLIAVLADPVFDAEDPRVRNRESPGADRAEFEADNLGTRSANSSVPDLPRLRHTRREAEAILDMVPANLGTLALDFEASKQSVQAGDFSNHRIVHFATHGVLDAREPALSGIVLSRVGSNGQPVDGFLRTHEIYGLDLAAELVVLGACETALGKEVRGEGLIGLARGFMYAGARRIMVSLWRVDDRSTAALMTAFYREMLLEGMAPPAALRLAQLEVRRQSPQPFYWAGFVLQGEWQPTTFE